MHIAIEGMDGVGKTSTAKLLAQRMNYIFVDKPLHLLLDNEAEYTNYLKISNYLNTQENINLKAMFYGVSNLYLCERFKNKNIITDRYLVSNYFWNSSETNDTYFEFLASVCKKPDITILLYANDQIRSKRIVNRNINDKDLLEIKMYPEAYNKMIFFLKRYNMKYVCIDNSEMNLDETVEKIRSIISNDET